MPAKLTEAQRWALQAIADGYGDSPAYLGQRMMERPGVEERRRGGNRDSRQGLGRIGGTMMARLQRMGLVTLSWGTRHFWHAARATITEAGRNSLLRSGSMTDSPSPSDTPALPEATEDLIDHACSLAMGYGTGRDDIAGQFIHAKVAVKARFAALLARAEAAEKERDEARATLKYCETCWSEERGTMIDKIQSLRSIANVNGDWTVKVSQMQARIDALTAEVARLREAVRGNWHGVFLDGRNEHGSHVLCLPHRSIELETDGAGDFLKCYAETILQNAEAAGFKVGDAVVATFEICLDEGFSSHYEYIGVSPDLTAALYGTPVEQAAARAALSPVKQEPNHG